MGELRDLKPAMAMLGLQLFYSVVSLSTRAALLQGMSPRAFVVYRQAIATLFMAPIAYFSRRKSSVFSMGLKGFSLIFLASLIGVTINQNLYLEGMYLASSSMGSAMANLIPAITFLMASVVGLEKIDIRSLRSIAKIVGTLLCVSGAMSMALLRGPKLLNSESLPHSKSLFGSPGGEDQNWLLGCLFLFASSCCWSFWLTLQVSVSSSCPDYLSQSAWMCFLATLQSATITLVVERDSQAWILNSNLEIISCVFAGIIGSGLSYFVQAWCISKRGPLFAAMFNPLGTVIVTILAAFLLHEEIYTGCLIGGVGVILGLYIVLWGKAKDSINEEVEKTDPKLQRDEAITSVKILIDDDDQSSEKTRWKTELGEPLLFDKSTTDNNASEIHPG